MISSFMIAPQDEMKMKSSKYLSSAAKLFTSTKTMHNHKSMISLNTISPHSFLLLEPLLSKVLPPKKNLLLYSTAY